jgi:hypothetical protein
LAVVVTWLATGPAWAADEPQIVQFTPLGTVKKVRQVTARFSEPMVPLGDPRVASPFEVECAERGAARWVDSRTWAYDFERDLPAGIRCTFRLRADVKSLAGRAVVGPRELAFSTGGPAVLRSSPWQGATSIDEEQAFLLLLDAEPTEASVLAHVYFAVEGLAERIGVRLVTGADRERILKTRWREAPPGPVIVLQARQRLPDRAKVRLVWGTGVAAATGVANDQDQTLQFQVRGPFVVTLRCEREHAQAHCLPITPIRATFSGPVPWERARGVELADATGHRFAMAPNERRDLLVDEVVFPGPFPESSTLTLAIPRDLRDDAGRAPVNASQFPLAFKTESYPPLAKFPARFGIVEAKVEPVLLPVTLRNLEPAVASRLLPVERPPVSGTVSRIPAERAEEILHWLLRVNRAERTESVFADPRGAPAVQKFELPKPTGDKAFEVVGVPLPGPGLYVVELESLRLGTRLLGDARPMYVPAAALVTNLAVHFKWGPEASLVWVTTLDAARPVARAQVSIHTCRGDVAWSGETDASGVAWARGLPERSMLRCPPDELQKLGLGPNLLVVARTAGDMSFTRSDWTQGIEPWRFRLPYYWGSPELAAHTILDRALFRAGETVHMKHVLRQRTLTGFAAVPADKRPGTLVIRHAGSEEVYKLPLEWDTAGIAESTWPIPRGARLGRYEIALFAGGKAQSDEAYAHGGLVAGDFRVEEFRVPLMSAALRPPTDPLVGASGFPVDIAVRFLAGGGAAKLPVTLRTQLRPRFVPAPDRFEEFVFANGVLKPGVERGGVVEELEAPEEEGEEGQPAPAKTAAPAIHQRQSLVLDAAGTGRATVTDLPRVTSPMEVLAELEFRDPNGQVQTAATRVPLWPSSVLAGLQADHWVESGKTLKGRVAVVDVQGKPVAGAPVRVTVLRRQLYSHRTRLVGGFYAYEHVAEVTEAGELCRGTTDASGAYWCSGQAPADGELILQATAADPAGRASGAFAEVWIPGSEAWFRVTDSDRMDLLPDKRRYEPGETARFQVRMPFRQATALVTLEREGVLEARVVPLSGTNPVIEVPIKAGYAPNMYVSVLAVRGRAGDAPPTALVDLGRPAYKLGIAEINVGWRAHELKVSVAADRPTYRVRQKATVRVSVRRADGTTPPGGTEVAIAAVDEGLLELLPNRTWNLLESMMQRRAYLVTTATAQGQVIGKRHFGLKALPQGGGGGRTTTRELFDTLLVWKGRVPLDASGEATVEIPLNDSLTAFRIVAVATGQLGLFGTGATTIRSTQDLMLFAGIAPLVREGDRFRSEVTLRNATASPMDLRVLGRVQGLPKPLEPQPLTLAAGESAVVGWDLVAPAGARALKYDVEVQSGGRTLDRLTVSQEVRPAVPVRTLQATLFQLDRPQRQPVQRPADALPGAGGVRVGLSPSLVVGLTGVREWMLRYPYTCLEQRVSRAVALHDDPAWQAVVAALPAHIDGDGLLKYFPQMFWGDPVLTAYVLAIAHEAGHAIPPDIVERLAGGLRKFVEGKIIRGGPLPTADLPIRKLAALDALSRYGKADAALLGTITIEPNLWPTSAVLDWWGVLQRLPDAPQRAARLIEAEQILRARLTLQGTTMGFSTEQADGLWWLMVSSDANAARLILHLVTTGQWKDDIGRILRGALGRQQHGRWDLTTANAWGVLAVEKFARAFEKAPVAGVTELTFAGSPRRVDWAMMPRGGTLAFPWPVRDAELTLAHQGSGAPWVTVQSQAAIPLKAPLGSGYRITKTLAPVEAKQPGSWTRGDVVRVTLTVEAQADMTWVVVSDPIPAGASHLGSGLGRESEIAVSTERQDWRAWPAFEERGFEAYRAYYAFLPKGPLTIEYTIRLNQSGTFSLPPTRVEALYAPEAFGEIPNAPVVIAQ